MNWHDVDLCPRLENTSDRDATSLAMPIMVEVVRRRLFRFLPIHKSEGTEPAPSDVDFIGVELGCPHPSCAGKAGCPARGYRVARKPSEISAAL